MMDDKSIGDMLKVLVVIPAYNESDNIVKVVESVVSAGYDYIVVNDGSIDNTIEVCEEHGFNPRSQDQFGYRRSGSSRT